MDRRTRQLLRDALGATEEILEHTQNVDLQAYSADRMRQRTTYYAFAILGEALNKLMSHKPSLRSALHYVRMANDMRNRLIHGYSSVDVGIVWSTIGADIPNLRNELRGPLDSQ